MATMRSRLRAIAVAGILFAGVPALPVPTAAQARDEIARNDFQGRIERYERVLEIGRAKQADLRVREACLAQGTAVLEHQNDQLEARLGELLRRLDALEPQINAQAAAATELQKQVEDADATVRPLAAEEAAWNARNQPYLRWKQACEDAWKGDWGASQVCRAGATYPGNRSFEEPLAAARRRLQSAQDSLAAAQRGLAASREALLAAQQQRAAAAAEKDQVQPALAHGKAQLSEISGISFEAGGLLNEFGTRLTAAMTLDREDERPRTVRLLDGYALRTLETVESTNKLIARLDSTHGVGWASPCTWNQVRRGP